MPESRTVDLGGVTLATEAFGAPGDPALLLVMGATASMLWWPDALCEALAARGRRVIRFDHRDTGLSSSGDLPPYAVEDLADDLFSVLDGWGLGWADLAGMSLGALVAQVAALQRPDRVRSLTLIAAEPLGWDGPDLPGMDPAILDHFAGLAALDWDDAEAVEGFLMGIARLSAGPSFDEVAERARVRAEMARAPDIRTAFTHAGLSLQKDWTGRLHAIAVPTLVLHGAMDPVLPLPNGEALASTIPDARLVVLPDLGHALPPSRLPEIAGHVAAFLDSVPERTP